MPMLFWTVSGVVMVWKPIEEVRGEHLLAEPAPMRLATPPVAAARSTGVPLKSLTLEPRAAGPRWVVTLRRWHDPARRSGERARCCRRCPPPMRCAK